MGFFPRSILTQKNKARTLSGRPADGRSPTIRLAREGLALASVAGFVWMVCQVAQLRRVSRRRSLGRGAGLARIERRLRPSSHPVGLFPARRRDQGRRPRQAGGRGGHAGGGAHRPGQSVRRAGVLRRQPRTPACSRSSAARCRSAASAGPAGALGADPDRRAAGAERGRLAQSHRALHRRLSGCRPATTPQCPGQESPSMPRG